MIVWKLQTGIDYTNFYFPLEEEKEFFTEFVENYFDESKSAQDIWKPLILLKGEPKKATHFFEVNGSGVIAMGSYGNLIFENGLGENVELLPLETDGGPFNVLNIIGYLDCLDKEKSKYTLEDNGLISDYHYLRFKKELLEGIYLFKIPELPYTTFVTRNFEKIYSNHVGKGLDLGNENIIWEG